MRLTFQIQLNPDWASNMKITPEKHIVKIIVPFDNVAVVASVYYASGEKYCYNIVQKPAGVYLLCLCAFANKGYTIRFMTRKGPLVPVQTPAGVHVPPKLLCTLALPCNQVRTLQSLVYATWYIQGISLGTILSTGMAPGAVAQYTYPQKLSVLLIRGQEKITTCWCNHIEYMYAQLRWNYSFP